MSIRADLKPSEERGTFYTMENFQYVSMQWIRKNLRDRSCHELSIWLKMGYPSDHGEVMVKLLDGGSRLPPHALGTHLFKVREGASSLMIDSLAVVTGSTPRKCYQSHLGCIGNNPKYIYIYISYIYIYLIYIYLIYIYILYIYLIYIYLIYIYLIYIYIIYIYLIYILYIYLIYISYIYIYLIYIYISYIYIFISVYPVECDNPKTNVGQYVPLNNRQQACRTRPLPSIQSTCNMQIGMCISRIISMVLAETQLHVLNISSYTGYLLVINPLRSGSHTYNLLEYP